MYKQAKNTESCFSSLPMLRNFLCNIYQARNYDDAVSLIDQALNEGDVNALIKIATESDPNNENKFSHLDMTRAIVT